MITKLPTANLKFGELQIKKLYLILFVLFLGSNAVIAQATDSGYAMKYRFSIDGITAPSEAEQAKTIISGLSFTSGIDFIDECDCFKVLVHEPITYDDLYDPLKSNQLTLSNILYGEDGSELKKGLMNELKE